MLGFLSPEQIIKKNLDLIKKEESSYYDIKSNTAKLTIRIMYLLNIYHTDFNLIIVPESCLLEKDFLEFAKLNKISIKKSHLLNKTDPYGIYINAEALVPAGENMGPHGHLEDDHYLALVFNNNEYITRISF